MKNLYRILILSLLLNLCFSGVKAQGLSNNDSLPLDSSIRYGKLRNGFTYFIKSISGPEENLYLKFYSRAGSNQEDMDQLNIAHGIEHLAFKSTKNFPEGIRSHNGITEEGMGMYDYYAFSGPITTIYNFDAPHNSSKALDIGLLWFKDIATGLKLNEADINQVTGELRQEFLSKVSKNLYDSNANYQLNSRLFNCTQDLSNYLEYIKTFDPEIMRRFYKDWYRPDLLAISVVGNIEDIEGLEKQIQDSFEDLRTSINPKKLRNCHDLYFKRPPQFHIVQRFSETSKIIRYNKVNLQLIYRYPLTRDDLQGSEGIIRLLSLQLLIDVANERLREATKEYKSFNVGIRNTYKYGNQPPSLNIQATLQNTGVKKAIEKIMEVLNQLRTYGISHLEWNKLKQNNLQLLNPGNEANASYWNDEIQKYYSLGEALPSNKTTYLKEWLLNLSLLEFNDFIKQFLTKQPEDIGIVAPGGHKALALTEKEVRNWVDETYNSPVKPFKNPNVPSALMSAVQIARLKASKVVNSRTGKTGARELILNNGVKLVLKSFQPSAGYYQDKIKIHGFKRKGANCFPEEFFFSAINAPSIISNAGVNQMDKFKINRFLTYNNITSGAVLPYIDYDETGIQAITSMENLENVLQLLYLYFTSPNQDRLAFEDWKLGKLNTNKDASDWDFKNALKKINGDKNILYFLLGRKTMPDGSEYYQGIEKTDPQVAYNIYKTLFGNAKDFTFIVSGDFNVDSISPILIKYLGNLPNLSPFPDVCVSQKKDISLPTGPILREISLPVNYEMNNIIYGINFFHRTAKPADWKEHLKVEALGEVTTHKVWGLRFEKNYSLYRLGMSALYNKNKQRYEISSTFDCVPDEFNLIRNEVHEILTEMKSGKITKELFQKGMVRMYSLYNSQSTGGSHLKLHQNLYEHYRYGQPFIDPVEVERFVKSLTVEDITEMANKYFKKDNMYEFVMRGNN